METKSPTVGRPENEQAATFDLERTHRALAHWNHRRLVPTAPSPDWTENLAEDSRMLRLEGAWVEAFREEVREAVDKAPCEETAFLDWFESLREHGPGQNDPLFDWLACEAQGAEMDWFLTQEASGEAGFDDLVAMAQVRAPTEPKLELARNYWDEMGRGHLGGMHGPMLDRVVQTLGLKPRIEDTVWQSLALANTLTAFATTRRYAWHAIGALGVVELTAPGRVAKIAEGLKRLGRPPAARKYFELHAHLDLQHSRDWNTNVLRPLVREDPSRARYLAEGALMRLICGQRCFDVYRRDLWDRPGVSLAAE